MKKKILAIMMAGIATCTVFTVCGKTESNAIGSQVSISAETVTMTLEPVAKATEIKVNTLYAKGATKSAGYTYADLSKTMYAKSTVNVRSLPSTSGNKLGSLSKNQEVAVTGQCNETGWYRIAYNNTEGFVSNKYLVDEPVAAAAGTKTAQAGAQAQTAETVVGSNPSGKVDPNDPSTWAPPHENMYYDANLGQWLDMPADGYNRAVAEQVFAYVNEERAAAGLNTLTWDENAYNFACQRAQAIVTNFSHEGCGNYKENIYSDPMGGLNADYIHKAWYYSPGHHNNYMNPGHVSGACAVYTYDGTTYAVEEFTLASSPQTEYATPQTREVNGTTADLSGAEAKAYDEGSYWTASNGITVYITGNGTTSTSIPEGRTMDEAMAAVNEYLATH